MSNTSTNSILETITTEQWGAIAAWAAEMAGKATLMQEHSVLDEDSEKQLYRKVSEFLRNVGIPANIRGYRYVRCAIMMAYNNPEYVEAITKILYPEVAKKFGTTGSRVERSIRHGIEVAWLRADIEELSSIFNWSINKGKPTNSEFIAFSAEYLKNSC